MNLSPYLTGIWNARFFWLHLANSDLRYKFRRSKLGLLWSMINPLIITLMISFIMGNLLKVPMQDYAPYVYSGIVVWEFLSAAVIGGCHSILSGEPYIKQYKHPIVIYPLKSTVVNIATMAIAMSGLLIWTLFTRPQNLPISFLVLPFSLVFLFLIGWPLTILTSFTHIKYRDFGQVIALVMQLLWYMSPVFFESKMFTSINMTYLVDYNPITHILNLVRAPILSGVLPTWVDLAYVLGTIAVLYFFAFLKVRSNEKTIIYYF